MTQKCRFCNKPMQCHRLKIDYYRGVLVGYFYCDCKKFKENVKKIEKLSN